MTSQQDNAEKLATLHLRVKDKLDALKKTPRKKRQQVEQLLHRIDKALKPRTKSNDDDGNKNWVPPPPLVKEVVKDRKDIAPPKTTEPESTNIILSRSPSPIRIPVQSKKTKSLDAAPSAMSVDELRSNIQDLKSQVLQFSNMLQNLESMSMTTSSTAAKS